MSKFYCPLELDFSDLVEYVKNSVTTEKLYLTETQVKIVHTLPSDLKEKINRQLQTIGFPNVWYVQSYIRKKSDEQGIHIDGFNKIVHSAINIPVSGTIGSKHVFYSGDYELKQIVRDDIQFYDLKWKSIPVTEDVLELTDPHLLRVDVPHKAVANDVENRWIITLRMEGNPKYEDLVKQYEKYIQSNVN